MTWISSALSHRDIFYCNIFTFFYSTFSSAWNKALIIMLSSNQLASYVFSDGKLIPIKAEMAQTQIRSLFICCPHQTKWSQIRNTWIKFTSCNLLDFWEKPCNRGTLIEVGNRNNNNSFLSELTSNVQNHPAVWSIKTKRYPDLHKKTRLFVGRRNAYSCLICHSIEQCPRKRPIQSRVHSTLASNDWHVEYF